jgi:hypothetical protein
MASSKKTIAIMDCGCEIIEREQIANLSPVYHTIDYCPKHKAAPAMYEALKFTVELTAIARKYFPKSIKHNDRFTLENACAAINKALAKVENK